MKLALGRSSLTVKNLCETPVASFESVCIKRRSNCGSGVSSRLFPPRHSAKAQSWHNKGRQTTSYLTINGRVKFIRSVFWNPRAKPGGQSRRRYIRKGSDQRYKEFKILAFYDPSHERQYATGTSGDHQVLGRMMRRQAAMIKFDRADIAYSVSDGAPWIRRQYGCQLPMLKVNILDYYHLRDHVIKAACVVFGEGTAQAVSWWEQLMGCVLEQGPIELLDRIGLLLRKVRSKTKRQALQSLRQYIGKRLAMLDYPSFKAAGYEIGSGPTEAFCKTLTSRLKGPGMRWDKPNAEGLMALASVRSSSLWRQYWNAQKKLSA
jgi:hypothetical protein